MPNFTWPRRRDVPLISDAALAALLTGAELPPGAAPQLRPLAETLAALAGRPAEDELAGGAGTLTAFRDHFGAAGPARHAGRGHRPRLYSRPLPLSAAMRLPRSLDLAVSPRGLRRGAADWFATACPRCHWRASGGRPAGCQAVSGNSGRHGPAWLRPVYRVGTSQGTRHPQAASRGLRQTGGSRGRRRQRNRVLHRRDAHGDAAICPPGPGCHTATPFRPADRPAHATRLRQADRPAHATRLRPADRLPTPHGSGKPSALPTPPNPGGTTAHLTQRLAWRNRTGSVAHGGRR